MSTETSRTVEGIRDLQDAVERLIKGIHDPEVIQKACDDMDRMREETRQRIGTVEVAVELVPRCPQPMKYILDASVAIKWVLPEPDSSKALSLRDGFQRRIHELIAPGERPIGCWLGNVCNA